MNDQPQCTGPEYDVFVSYSSADREWVEGYLLDALNAANVHVLSELNFALGAPRLAFLVALDATYPQNWPNAVARLCSTLHAALPVPAASPQCPYPGMRAFREQDATDLTDLTNRSGLNLWPICSVYQLVWRKHDYPSQERICCSVTTAGPNIRGYITR